MVLNFKNTATWFRYRLPRLYKFLLSKYQRRKYKFTQQYNGLFLEQILSLKGDTADYLDIAKYDGDVTKLFKLRQAMLAFKFSSIKK